MTEPTTHVVEFDGSLVRRAFWLYVMEATTPDGDRLLYVGRTGDSSSANAQSPFNRLGQHLGTGATTSQMRRHLAKRGLEPEACRFRFVAFGPVLAEAASKDTAAHFPLRDKIAPMEKELAVLLAKVGYSMLNSVPSKKPLDEDAFQPVLEAFAEQFPKLRSLLAS